MGVLDGRVAIITGAGAGIGREHALAFAAAGAKVVVNDIGVDLDGSGASDAPAESVAGEIRAAGGTAISNVDSVADFDASARIVESAIAAFGGLDIVLNNASIFRGGPFETVTPADFAAELGVHLVGTFNMCKHAIPRFVGRGWGRIINTSSSGWHSASGLAGYAAAKAGVLGLSFDLAAEFWRSGVTVNVICPVALTEHRVAQGRQWIDKLREAGLMEDFLASMTMADEGHEPPERRPEAPDHVPPLAVFLASDAGGSISGKVFEVTDNEVGVFAHPQVEARVAKDGDTTPWTQAELEGALASLFTSRSSRAPHLPRP